MNYTEFNTMMVSELKRTLTMNIEKYVDVCLIDEYADKDSEDGYYLDVSSLPKNELVNFLDKLMQEDTLVKDFILYQMQKIIDERCREKEFEYRENLGITMSRRSNGDYEYHYPRSEA